MKRTWITLFAIIMAAAVVEVVAFNATWHLFTALASALIIMSIHLQSKEAE